MRSVSGRTTPPKWRHDPAFADASKSAANNLAIPFFGPPLLFAHVIGHRRQAASISMVVAQALKNTLRRVTLFFDEDFVGVQYLVGNTNIIIKGWTTWCF